MAIDELTDAAFFDLYQKNPQIKDLVDGIQRKYHVHHDQKGQPEYDKKNIPIAMREAKETVKKLLKQQKQGEGAHESSKGPDYISTSLKLLATGLSFAIHPALGIGIGGILLYDNYIASKSKEQLQPVH